MGNIFDCPARAPGVFHNNCKQLLTVKYVLSVLIQKYSDVDSALLVLNGTSLNSVSALQVLSHALTYRTNAQVHAVKTRYKQVGYNKTLL